MEENLKETLVMVADYTEVEKEKLLNKVYVCGQGTLIISIVLMLLFFFEPWIGYQLVLTPFLLILACGIFAINTLLTGLQLKGRMSKQRNKKLIRITVTIWVILAVLILIFVTFLLPNLFYTDS